MCLCMHTHTQQTGWCCVRGKGRVCVLRGGQSPSVSCCWPVLPQPWTHTHSLNCKPHCCLSPHHHHCNHLLDRNANTLSFVLSKKPACLCARNNGTCVGLKSVSYFLNSQHTRMHSPRILIFILKYAVFKLCLIVIKETNSDEYFCKFSGSGRRFSD